MERRTRQRDAIRLVFEELDRPLGPVEVLEHGRSRVRGLGMPSSHVLVAFAGAAALARLFPRATLLWYLLAIGCAATRVLALGHFLSDVVAAAVLGWFVAELLWRRMK